MFHGVDERVPVSALRFGVRVMERLLTTGSTSQDPEGVAR
jgi:acetylornithine deacetylase/succinyl-diaminopimelate desuccinylase-like protein